jgi:hypothetical protein
MMALKSERGIIMDRLDYKKKFRELYMPKTEPSLIDVPEMVFVQVEGRGDPNEPGGGFQIAIEIYIP